MTALSKRALFSAASLANGLKNNLPSSLGHVVPRVSVSAEPSRSTAYYLRTSGVHFGVHPENPVHSSPTVLHS